MEQDKAHTMSKDKNGSNSSSRSKGNFTLSLTQSRENRDGESLPSNGTSMCIGKNNINENGDCCHGNHRCNGIRGRENLYSDMFRSVCRNLFDDTSDDARIEDIDLLNLEEEKHFCNVCFSFLYYKKYCFYELLRIYRNFCLLKEEEKKLLTESIHCKLYKMYLSVLNNYYFIMNILLPQISTHIILHLLAYTCHRDNNGIESEITTEGEHVCENGHQTLIREEEHNGGEGLVEGEKREDHSSKAYDQSREQSCYGGGKSEEETTINEILNNLTNQEKDHIDKVYNYYNLDVRLLCKDDPITIVNEIKCKIMNSKNNNDIYKLINFKQEFLDSSENNESDYDQKKKLRERDQIISPVYEENSLQNGVDNYTTGEGSSRGFGKKGEDNEVKGSGEGKMTNGNRMGVAVEERRDNANAIHGVSGDNRDGGNGRDCCNERDDNGGCDCSEKKKMEKGTPSNDDRSNDDRSNDDRSNDDCSNDDCSNGDCSKGEHIPPGMRITNAYMPTLDEYSLMQNMSKVRSTLRQFVRDWSVEGKHERENAYEPLLQSLEKYLPITDEYVPKILCPGSGLGRLPYEVAKKGYRSQGNEFSYFMLLSSNFILNYYNKKNSLRIQPYCLNTLNRKGRDDHLKIVHLPDVNTYNKAVLNTEFSMCAGELIEVYYNEKEQFDGVLTCFFLDTAKNIFMYIRTFANILKPNSLWSNVGPLLYHYAEMPNEMSIELSWEEIKLIISKWFTFIEIKWIDNYYTTNTDSMMQVQYHCVFFNALRNDVPVED
ncbi:hypothetical protein, conserved [Plasmodium ovale curtisi]|uniref:carnosine N-methyltransferase n=1 Tax=Plasmodium ovale curtisi TaxID=864141 RepID=A0A1A8WCM8_PLAOA|nr:hypothetical protein, conserved [Plasmodium ovale curtisi]